MKKESCSELVICGKKNLNPFRLFPNIQTMSDGMCKNSFCLFSRSVTISKHRLSIFFKTFFLTGESVATCVQCLDSVKFLSFQTLHLIFTSCITLLKFSVGVGTLNCWQAIYECISKFLEFIPPS